MPLSYTGALFTAPHCLLRSPSQIARMARTVRHWGTSSQLVLESIKGELESFHTGPLYGLKDAKLDLDAMLPKQLWEPKVLKQARVLGRWTQERWGGRDWSEITLDLDDVFPVDDEGWMADFLRYADAPPSRALPRYIAPRLMMIDFAIEIRTRRNDPACEQRELF